MFPFHNMLNVALSENKVFFRKSLLVSSSYSMEIASVTQLKLLVPSQMAQTLCKYFNSVFFYSTLKLQR
jgi:hypothetical protein